MRNTFRHRLPDRYYTAKQRLRERIRRYHRQFFSKNDVAQMGRNDPCDCILVFSCESASSHYRVTHAAEVMKLLGLSPRVVTLDKLDYLRDFGFLQNVRFLLLHRLPMNLSLNVLIHHCKRKSIPVISDLDDAIHDPVLYAKSAVFDLLSPIEKRLHLIMSKKTGETLSASDASTVSTDALADFVGPSRTPVFVIPNRISTRMIEAAHTEDNTDRNQYVIGYMSGSETHHRDFASIHFAVSRCLEVSSNAHLLIAGPLKLPVDMETRFSQKISHVPLKPWPDYLSYYNRLTVNLAPLEPGNPFCLAKSGVKFLESALSAVPTIAYPTTDFQRLIQHGKTGFLAQSCDDWEDILHQCMRDPDCCLRLGKAAQDWVLNNETILANINPWKNCLKSLDVIV